MQGDPANVVFYTQKGRVKLTVISEQGKAAIIGVLNGGNFFGEGCIAGQLVRMMTATAITDCSLVRIEKSAMMAALHERHDFSEFAVVLPETGASAANVVARRICNSLENDAKEPRLSVSVGIAIYPRDGRTIENLLHTADRALYKMKGERKTAFYASG